MANMRQHDRVKAEVRVALDGTSAITRDVSPGGAYIIADGDFEVGQSLRFMIEFDNPVDGGGVLCLDCVGVVQRVDDEGGKRGIGVSFTESRLERHTRRTTPAASRKGANIKRG